MIRERGNDIECMFCAFQQTIDFLRLHYGSIIDGGICRRVVQVGKLRISLYK